MNLLPIEKPEINIHVKAVIKNISKWDFVTNVVMYAVDESDCDWRFCEDDCKLSFGWDVVYWEYPDS